MIRQVLVMVVAGTTLASVSSPDLKMGIRVQGTLTLNRVQHPEEADPSTRRAMEVMCSVRERTVPSVIVLTVKSENRALMLSLDVVRTGTLSRSAHRTGIRLEVILSLGLIHRVKQQSSPLRGTGSMP